MRVKFSFGKLPIRRGKGKLRSLRKRLRRGPPRHHEVQEDVVEHEEQHHEEEEQHHEEEEEMEEEEDGVVLMPKKTIVALANHHIVPHETSIVQLGWHKYFQGYAGGCRTEDQSNTILKIVIKFLLRVHSRALQMEIAFDKNTTMMHFFQQLVMVPALFEPLMLLLDNYPYTESSLCIHIYAVKDALKFLEHNLRSNLPEGFDRAVEFFRDCLSNAGKGAKRKVKRGSRLKDTTIETAVKDRKFPPGGLVQLQASLKTEADRIILLFSAASMPELHETLYKNVLEVIICAFYCFSVQGRVGAFELFNMANYRELVAKTWTLSRHFKTQGTHIYQPILADPLTLELVVMYFEKIRPHICPPNTVASEKDVFFLTYQGRPFSNIGRLITSFWREREDLSLTATTFRSLVTSDVNRRVDAGELGQTHIAAVAKINGHLQGTSREYYLKTMFALTVQAAREAMGTPLHADAAPAASVVVPALVAKVWGSSHPSFGAPHGQKAPWSIDELDYLRTLCAGILEQTPEKKGRLMSIALRMILKDEQAQPVFLWRHVATAARLRAGYLASEK